MRNERHFYTKTCMPMFLEALLLTAKNGGNLNKCPLTDITGWIMSPKKAMLKM